MRSRVKYLTGFVALAFPVMVNANVLIQLPNLPINGGTPSNTFAYAYGLSADGNTIVGTAGTVLNGKNPFDAVDWKYNGLTQSATITDIGSLNSQRLGSPNALASAVSVSGDGSVVVGFSTASSSSTQFDFYASNQTTPATLTNIQFTLFSGVRVSEDGKVLVEGAFNSTYNGIVFNRLDGNGWVALPQPTGAIPGIGNGYSATDAMEGGVSNVNAAGGAPVFTGLLGVSNATTGVTGLQAFRYSTSTGYVAIGTPYSPNTNVVVSPTTTKITTLGYYTPVSADGNFMASVGTNPTTGKEDAFEYNATTGTTTWFNAAELSGFAFTPTAITDDGSFVVGRDFQSNSNQDGWIWSASTGFETIGTFLTSEGLSPSSLGSGAGAGDVYGVALNGNTLSLTGLVAGGSRSVGSSFYSQITVPEPTSLTLFSGASMLLLGRRRRSRM